MFKRVEIVNQSGNTTPIPINSENVVFLSEVEIPTNVVGLDGQPKSDTGTALALSNGMMLNSKMKVENVVKLFEGD